VSFMPFTPVTTGKAKRWQARHTLNGLRIEETDEQPHLEWTGKGIASASDGLTIQSGRTRSGYADDLKTLLIGEWQESAGIKTKLLSIGYGVVTVSGAIPCSSD
jgi:hypothetical protein